MTPAWAMVPFAAYLVLLAVGPAVFHVRWHDNRFKLVVALATAAPVAAYLVARGMAATLLHAGVEYVAFIALLGALFAVAGGIHVRGAPAGTTRANTFMLALGAVLASLVGTTGASMLLIRPVLHANAHRPSRTHVFVFFIFIVANAGGLLTPLGDPPLFLGYLRGVPFTWTIRLLPAWALVNGALLVVFAVVDAVVHRREPAVPPPKEPPHLEGKVNLLWLGAIVVVVLLIPAHRMRTPIQVTAIAAIVLLSWRTTSRAVRVANRFSWDPMLEVAAIFLGVFTTMPPALSYLQEQGAALGVTTPAQFFWWTGAVSSVLDNAPTYLAFASLAVGVVDAGAQRLHVDDLGALAAHPTGTALLAAISCGAVFMGALTYLGNGPNLMVKAIAEQHGVRMPGFFTYLLWATAVLVPILVLVTLLFF